MFERFTERARQVIVFAQDESRRLNHDYIGTEHLLLGLLREEEGLAARLLVSLRITLDDVRGLVASTVGEGIAPATGQIPFTPRAKNALELSLREALSLGHNYIGTEHVLLGLVRDGEGMAARILDGYGANAALIREEMLTLLSGGEPRELTLVASEMRLDVNEWADAAPERAGSEGRALIFAIALAAASFPLGLLLGWLIWG